MAIFRSKSGNYGELVPGKGTHLETIFCAISPPNTWDNMILGHFLLGLGCDMAHKTVSKWPAIVTFFDLKMSHF